MDLRLCFENKAGVRIDDEKVFQHYAFNYLSGFPVVWAGIVSLSHHDCLTTNMQPLWQMRIRDASAACRLASGEVKSMYTSASAIPSAKSDVAITPGTTVRPTIELCR